MCKVYNVEGVVFFIKCNLSGLVGVYKFKVQYIRGVISWGNGIQGKIVICLVKGGGNLS